MKIALSCLGLLFLASGCGQDPSFVEASLANAPTSEVPAPDTESQSSADASVFESPAPTESSSIARVEVPIQSTPTVVPSAPANNTVIVPSAPQVPVVSPVAPALPSSPASPVIVPTFPSDSTTPSSPTFSVPGLTPSEQVQVAQCITKWGRVPFVGTFTNVRRIKAAVSVFGVGTMINDTVQTQAPALILVDAGVNVMGTPVYNLLNNNGYYCMKVNVNVKTDFDINLACNAKLADNSVQVNVASETNSETAVIGVNVGSSVQVNRMTPSHGQCQE